MTIPEYLRQLRRALRLRKVASTELVIEVSDHLRDLREKQMARGADASEAERLALARFGPVEVVAEKLAVEARLSPGRTRVASRRRSPPNVHGRRPRGPGGVYGVLSFVLLIVIGTLALTSQQSPPPTIAEFAPQAVEQITDASQDGSGSSGAPKRAGVAADPEEVTGLRTSPTVDVARVRSCVGDPPRQIEDPQSPPCVPHWAGDNGGATWRGVTRDEIRVADPGISSFAPELVPFFNKRFELYGRRIRLVNTSNGPECDGTPAGAESAAVAMEEQHKVFASLHSAMCTWSENYDNALARRGIIVVAGKWTSYTETLMRSYAPHMWSYAMALDAMQAAHADWACARFAGRAARYAKGPEALRKRVFGVFAHTGDAGWSIDTTPFRSRLQACGERPAVTFEFSGFPPDTATYENVMLQMRQGGVTTILCLCDGSLGWTYLAAAGTSNGYFPEWLVGSYMRNDDDVIVRLFVTPEQRSQAMGLTFQPRQTRMADRPAFWAATEMNPGAQSRYNEGFSPYRLNLLYRNLLVLAAGFQMAGPNLMPVTFERGLQSAVFPNPDHPIKAGRVGFGGRPGLPQGRGGSHSFTLDAAEYWWSNTDRGSVGGEGQAGAICYVDHGSRRMHGQFPAGDDPFFRPPCDSGG